MSSTVRGPVIGGTTLQSYTKIRLCNEAKSRQLNSNYRFMCAFATVLVFRDKNISIDLDFDCSSKSTQNISNRKFASVRKTGEAKISMELNEN